MPRGPEGQRRPADVIGNAVKVMRLGYGRWRMSSSWWSRISALARCWLGDALQFKLRHHPQAAVEELARYLRQHGDVPAVRAMRKEAPTPEQAMRCWVLCASGVESGL